jgi:hypothetical protein
MLSRSQHRPTEQQISMAFCEDRGVMHKLDTVHMSILLDELVDVAIFHPLGDHRKPAFAYRHSKQR